MKSAAIRSARRSHRGGVLSPLTMTLHYHQRTFDLLGVQPKYDVNAANRLDELERRRAFRLPASVREWYSQAGAVRLLRRYSNDDPPIPVAKLADRRRDTGGGGPHDLLAQGLLPFRYENQGVCMWAIRLTGADDPPVVVDVDTQFAEWIECAETFSKHIYCWMWDFAVGTERDRLVMANIDPVTDRTLERLNASFAAEPQTHGWPGHTQYRFRKDDQSILIWNSDEQADWFLAADTDQSLEALLRQLWDVDSLATGAYANSESCETLLKRLRRP